MALLSLSTRKESAKAIAAWVKQNGKWSLLMLIEGPFFIGDTGKHWRYVHTARVNQKSLEFYGQDGSSVERSGYQFSILPHFLDEAKWIMRGKTFWDTFEKIWKEEGA